MIVMEGQMLFGVRENDYLRMELLSNIGSFK